MIEYLEKNVYWIKSDWEGEYPQFRTLGVTI